MKPTAQWSRPPKVVSINEKAIDNIRYIRETMERAGSFTAVPGVGGMLMGASALVTAIVLNGTASKEVWFAGWMAEAALALGIGGWTMIRKARALGAMRGPGRKFAASLLPAMACGALLTVVLQQQHLYDLMPGTWLLLYGVAVINGGIYSVRIVPVMGLGFMVLGTAALLLPFHWAQWCMAAGFGGLQFAFGGLIARNYGG